MDSAKAKDETAPGQTIIEKGGGFHWIKKPRGFRWEPKEDITTYELALCLSPIIVAMGPYGEAGSLIDALPPEARRHFEEI